MKYQKPKVERFGGFRELTRIGYQDLATDGGWYGHEDILNGCGGAYGHGGPCPTPSTS